MFMSDGDIITSFRQAKDQQKQIQVLADLNSCTKAQMVNKLLELGLVDAGKAPKRGRGAGNPGRPVDEEQEYRRKSLYDAGATDAEMAEILGIARCTVASWRRRKGLPQHYKKDEQPKEEQAAPAAPEQPEAAAEPIEEPQPETAAEQAPVPAAAEVPIREEPEAAEALPDEEEEPGGASTVEEPEEAEGGAQEPQPMTASGLLSILQRVAQGWPDAPVILEGDGLLVYSHLSIVFSGEGDDSEAELTLHTA